MLGLPGLTTSRHNTSQLAVVPFFLLNHHTHHSPQSPPTITTITPSIIITIIITIIIIKIIIIIISSLSSSLESPQSTRASPVGRQPVRVRLIFQVKLFHRHPMEDRILPC